MFSCQPMGNLKMPENYYWKKGTPHTSGIFNREDHSIQLLYIPQNLHNQYLGIKTLNPEPLNSLNA